MSSPAINLLLTRRGPVWRVRILISGESAPRWKSYRVTDYPTPEAVVRRCIAGLAAAREKPKGDGPAEIPDEAGKHPLIHGIRVRWEFQPWLSA